MDEGLLLWIAVAEAALLAAALFVLLAHAIWIASRLRRRRPRLAAAVRALTAARDGQIPRPDDLHALAGLPLGAQVAVFADVGQSLGGVQKQRLAAVAARIGLQTRAQRWCRSRRWDRRLRGARLLTQLGGGERVVPALLADPHPEVRAQAGQWAAAHPEPEIVERLLEMLDDPETLCRFTVTDSLMRMGSACADPLLRHITAAGAAPAAVALEVAAGIADARFLAPGLKLCGSPDPRTRSLAATLVGSIGGSCGTDLLVELLGDSDAAVRVAAATALGRLGHWPAAGTLAMCLRDPAWEVRRAAAIALRSMDAVGLLLLRRALTDPDRFARDMARQILELPAEQPPRCAAQSATRGALRTAS